MARNTSKQHYLPASLIGNFSNKAHGARRKRPIWENYKTSFNPHITLPEKVAYIENLYTLKDPGDMDPNSADFTWTYVENNLQQSIDELINGKDGKISAKTWSILVCFIAQLFVRGFEFNQRFEDRLGPLKEIVTEDNTNLARRFELQRLYAPIMYADWMVLHNKSGVSIIENDLGYIPSMDPYTGAYGYGIPLNQKNILLITKGERTRNCSLPLAFSNNNWQSCGEEKTALVVILIFPKSP